MKELGIYIHIPFCIRKCEYCDFLSVVSDHDTREQYVNHLIKEIQLNPLGKKDRIVTSIFFGGGTPSILDAVSLTKILHVIKQEYTLGTDAEITMEMNPGSWDMERMKTDFPILREAGFNRLSLGLQSTDEKELKTLGRIHDYEQFLCTYAKAREAGFEKINVDLMMGLPGQKVEGFLKNLERVLTLSPEHLSIYSLQIEEGTPFYKKYAQDLLRREEGGHPEFLPEEETEREMYHRTIARLKQAGYMQYEISNFARDNNVCRHNDNCWKRIEYLGFGIGAASLFEEKRFSVHRDLNKYLSGIYEYENEETLSMQDQMEETMFLGLRRRSGVSKKEFYDNYHTTIEDSYGSMLDALKEKELIEDNGEYICITEKGLDIANYIMAQFLL